MAAFIDEDMNILHINTFVLYACTKKVEYPADIPKFFCKNWKILVMYWWFVHLMFWNFGFDVPNTGFLLKLELEYSFSSLCFRSSSSRQLFPGAIGAFSCWLAWEHAIFDLEADRQLFPGATSTSFRSSVFTRLTRYPKRCEESSSLLGLRITRLMGLAFAGIGGFGFAIGEPSFEVASWPLFVTALCFPTWSLERKSLKWLQENIEKLIMLNKQRWWFHSSHEKILLVRKSASWFWVSTHLIWILGSTLILSNNQSRATLWVLDTCLVVGLRPLIIVFFKNVQLRLTLRRMCVGG